MPLIFVADSAETESVCTLPSVTGPCRAAFRSYYFNSKTGRCEQFIYGGCLGNGNRFPTKQKCEQTCGKENSICTLPSETGPCRAAFRSYYFNSKTGQCEQFIYGGCLGNGNRFPTKQKCEQTCGKKENSICTLPSVTGPCRAAFRSYYFNSKTGRCEQFIYGGCLGNGNRFPTKQKCEQTCGKKENSICTLPSETGLCRAYFPSYYFNSKTGQCEQFIYGGCGGNGNRFPTKQKCEQTCSSSICTLPSETGLCRAYIPSYYFNSKTGRCERFIYGGCGGNGNRFPTLEKCKQTCGKELTVIEGSKAHIYT